MKKSLMTVALATTISMGAFHGLNQVQQKDVDLKKGKSPLQYDNSAKVAWGMNYYGKYASDGSWCAASDAMFGIAAFSALIPGGQGAAAVVGF